MTRGFKSAAWSLGVLLALLFGAGLWNRMPPAVSIGLIVMAVATLLWFARKR